MPLTRLKIIVSTPKRGGEESAALGKQAPPQSRLQAPQQWDFDKFMRVRDSPGRISSLVTLIKINKKHVALPSEFEGLSRGEKSRTLVSLPLSLRQGALGLACFGQPVCLS